MSLRPTASWSTLKRRAELLRATRSFFDQRGFLEVETPLLGADVVVDRHLDPIRLTLPDDPRRPDVGRAMWLQTSPEAAMKRLLSAGAEAIYQVTRSFRCGERGPLHNPEFTLVEWYRCGDTMQQGIGLLDELSQVLLGRGPAEVLSYAEAFGRVVGFDPHRSTTDELAAALRRRGEAIPESLSLVDRDGWLDWAMSELVAPHLGQQRPVVVYDWPATQAALARVRPGDPPLAERFELYDRGVELANGYHELRDAQELERRIAHANAYRVADGKQPLPLPERLLEAMRTGLPDCTGVALGFDRVVMLATGAESIDEVIPFPIECA